MAYAAIFVALAAAVVFRQGASPVEWQWIAIAVSTASVACVLARSRRSTEQASPQFLDLLMLSGLLCWMLLQMVPLPPWMIHLVSPERWRMASAARFATGYPLSTWLPISVAPPATFARILLVLPCMAAFVASRELASAWKENRQWLLAAPVLFIATAESLVGISQFFEYAAGKISAPVTASYANYDHFAGLLEIAFPFAVMWAAAAWYEPDGRRRRILPAGVTAAGFLAVAACLLLGVVVSASRTAFLVTLTMVAMLVALWIIERREAYGAHVSRRAWLLPAAVPLAVAILVPTNTLLLRFTTLPGAGQVAEDDRVRTWLSSIHLIGAYPLTGVGLGAFQRGLYPFERTISDVVSGFAHNDYLQVLAELGILGTALFAALGVYICWKLVRVVSRPASVDWALAAGVAVSLAAMGLHSLVDFNLYVPANALIFAWIAGIAASPGLGASGLAASSGIGSGTGPGMRGGASK